MAGAISINLLANVREAVAGVDSAADAVEEVSDRMHDLAKEGDTATDRMTDDFRDLTKAADKSSDALKSKFREAYQSVRRNSADAADNVARDQRRIGERSQEVGDEIRQNLGEGIANAARGDFESLADTIGDTLGGVTAGIGGIGTAAIGVAGALGIGAIIGAFKAAQEESDKLKEAAAEWADAYIEAGGRVLSATQVFEKAREIITDPEQYKQAQQNARDWGVNESVALLAMSGDTNALAAARDELANKEARLADLVAQGGAARGNLREETNELGAATTAGAESLDRLTEAQEIGLQSADLYSESLRLVAERTAGATHETDEFGDSVVTLPDGKKIYIDAETGQATDNVDQIETKVYGMPDGSFAVYADTSPADRELAALKERARNLDLTVTVNQQRGRFIE